MLAKAPAKMPWESWETSTLSAGREGEAALAGFGVTQQIKSDTVGSNSAEKAREKRKPWF